MSARLPRGIRNNNPGNIEAGRFAASIPGYLGSDGRFARFERPEQGIQAIDRLLNIYETRHGLTTPAQIVNRWAPSSENNVPAYIRALGFNPNEPLGRDPARRAQFIGAMIRHENGRAMPPEIIQAALGAPAGPAPAPPRTEPAYRPQAASADAMMGHESPAPSADAMMGHPAAPVPRDGLTAIARATGTPQGAPPSASAYAPPSASPSPQPRPAQTPQEWQKTVFANSPNTGNEAVDFNLQRDAINRGYASWAPGLNGPNQAPPQQNPMDMIRNLFPQPSQQNATLAQLLFGGGPA